MLIAAEAWWPLAIPFGIGALLSGRKLLDREGNRRRDIQRWARENVKELQRVAWEDRASAPQMKRLAALQRGVLEGWALLPAGYDPFLADDIFTILGEVESIAHLARRRAALRRHLKEMERGLLKSRVRGLAADLLGPEEPSMRRAFATALAGRRVELEGYDVILDGIGVINARIESAESLLGNLRGELLALGTKPVSGVDESGLARLRERVAYFRRGLDEVTRGVDTNAEELMAP